MRTAIQADIGALLEMAGARPRGNRHDCPKCSGLRTVTHSTEAFFCHKCRWKGNTFTLAKELGIYNRIPLAEYRELRRIRVRAREAAKRLYVTAHERQLELREELRLLGRMEQAAHDAGPDNRDTWEILAHVYAARPRIEPQLDALESSNPATVLAALNGSQPQWYSAEFYSRVSFSLDKNT